MRKMNSNTSLAMFLFWQLLTQWKLVCDPFWVPNLSLGNTSLQERNLRVIVILSCHVGVFFRTLLGEGKMTEAVMIWAEMLFVTYTEKKLVWEICKNELCHFKNIIWKLIVEKFIFFCSLPPNFLSIWINTEFLSLKDPISFEVEHCFLLSKGHETNMSLVILDQTNQYHRT